METMQLITTTERTGALGWSDEAIEAFFASAGLAVEVVEHCSDASCPDCFRPARAA